MIASYQAHANPLATTNSHTHVKTNLNYDHANRLLEVYKTINDADSTRRLIVRNDYDQLGQLKQKQLGQLPDQSFLETQDYTYNIRGWLKGINKDYANNDGSHNSNNRWFGMDLSYDWGFDSSQLNGNIAGNKWRSKGDGQQRAYGFGYDKVNRLLFSDFNQYTGGNWDKTAKIDFSSIMGNGSDPNTAYDENGNIKAMLQSGWQLGGSHPIDSLTYTYYNHSNKLQNVIDGRNDPTTTMGDFRTSSISPYNTGKTTAAVDYSYDVDGNMTRDMNKDIGSQTTDGIIYNHLNLPWQVKVRSANGTKGTITYIYDATGNKLKKTTLDSAGNWQTVTTYIGGFQYMGKLALNSGSTPADTLQFFGHEEGRVRVTTDTTGGTSHTAFKYDYFLKDHLGNTRMVLTDEQQSDKYLAATMETANSATEELYYSGLDNTRTLLPPGYPTDTTTNPNAYVARLNGGTAGPKVGPGIVLKVMSGDKFSIRASSWYRLNGSAPGIPANPLPDLLTALISGIGALPGGGHPSPAMLQANQTPISTNFSQFLQDTGSTILQTKPHAFINWVLFDNQFNYVATSSGFQQVGADQELKKHILANLPITESGYLYIYTSNETPNVDVFFDNLQVTHTRGPLLEETHYYPFGLTMAGVSDKALKDQYAENKYKYNGIEYDSTFGIDEYEARYRDLDPQTGRWWQIDPETEKERESLSPYASMANDPMLKMDPLGNDDANCCMGLLGKVKNLGRDIVVFTAAAANAWSTNQVGGAGRSDVNTMDGLTDHEREVAHWGQTTGDGVSIFTGTLEVSNGAAGEVASAGVATPVAVGLVAHGVSSIVTGISNLVKDFQKVDSKATNGEGGRHTNQLDKPADAQGDHSTFDRDHNGDIYKYQEWKTNDRNPSGFDKGKFFDGGTKDGKPGAAHFDKKTQQFVPTPHVKDANGTRTPKSDEMPDNARFKKPS